MLFSFFSAYTLRSNVYYLSYWMWAFKRIWHYHYGKGDLMYSPEYFNPLNKDKSAKFYVSHGKFVYASI